MNVWECYCEGGSERAICALRNRLQDTGTYNCPSLAPWERELYADVSKSEPYVDLAVTLVNGQTLPPFAHVRGVSYRDSLLTFEDDRENIYYVPNVAYWVNSYCDQ